MPTALALATVALGPIRRACWTGIVPVGIVVRVSFVWCGCLVSFLCGVFLCGVFLCGVFLCGVFLCGVFLCGVFLCGVFLCGVVSVFGIFCLVSLFVSLVGDRALGRSCYCITSIHVVCTASHHTTLTCHLVAFSPHPHSPHHPPHPPPHPPHHQPTTVLGQKKESARTWDVFLAPPAAATRNVPMARTPMSATVHCCPMLGRAKGFVRWIRYVNIHEVHEVHEAHVGTARCVTWSIDHIISIQAWITLGDVVIHEAHEAHEAHTCWCCS
jgi:hypothetical protein